ncbi:hypothetical protein LUZ63_019597 [Rhynchospora breviuscula]|uniref:BAH domain-containing protein n=1 Tax=Rhynchospora breviuscula TaxID=2022672 RepID=A0A9Q0C6M7_9POAL|nr:hypothetical protein LUZ63_019597 [Rhynchospora breviuscula]
MMNDNISFAWGDKGGLSKSNDQFYKNFQYDGTTYNLFDNVYLFKHGDPEPHLGKIVRIWEQADGKKKVNIVWFLHPLEIHKYLRSYRPSEKEVFLACGENYSLRGLADINPLEAIAGKCRVICTLKDAKNPQPSQADVERADHVFCKLFDVGRRTLTGKLPATIGSLKTELFLNKKEDLTSVPVPPAISNDATENTPASSSSSPIPVPLKPNLEISDPEAKGRRQEDKNSLKIRIPSIRKEDGRSESARTLVGAHKEAKTPVGTSNEDKVTKRVRLSDIEAGVPRENQIKKARAEENELHSLPSTTPPSPSRKIGANGVLQPEKRSVVLTGGLKSEKKIEDQTDVPRKRNADGNLKQPVSSTGQLKLQKEAEDQVEKVSTRAVDVSDRRKWFDYSGKNWVQKIQIEDQEGRLVLLQNFDTWLTASQIEDLIFRATSCPCTVRLVTNYMYGDPNYGMAYAFFRSKEAANQVVTKLTKAYLVLPSGRPLICSKGALDIPRQSTSFVGHLAIEKLKKKMTGDEMKKAVSTAHCSQSNTIEFEMALEWIAAQDRFAIASKKLSKKHDDHKPKK